MEENIKSLLVLWPVLSPPSKKVLGSGVDLVLSHGFSLGSAASSHRLFGDPVFLYDGLVTTVAWSLFLT